MVRWLHIFLLSFALFGCAKNASKEFELAAVPFDEINGWTTDDFSEALPALKKSCRFPKQEWWLFCKGLDEKSSSEDVRSYLENNLIAYLVSSKGDEQGTFTGYYEASLMGSMKKTERYSVPIYGLPANLLRIDLSAFGIKNEKKQIVGRLEEGRFIPYYTRQDVNKMQAPVLLWVDNEVDVFILHVQGSGRVETEDGVVHIGYAGNNGHKFKGIGAIMSDAGVLNPGKSSMSYIREWLKENPKQAQEMMDKNPRFIFFKILPQSDGPLGASGVELTPQRSVAIDTKYIPLNTPLFLNTTDPDGKKIERLVVAQDIGSAIKGVVRADFFWGYGEEAFQKAGRMKNKGKYYLLWPKGKKLPALIE